MRSVNSQFQRPTRNEPAFSLTLAIAIAAISPVVLEKRKKVLFFASTSIFIFHSNSIPKQGLTFRFNPNYVIRGQHRIWFEKVLQDDLIFERTVTIRF